MPVFRTLLSTFILRVNKKDLSYYSYKNECWTIFVAFFKADLMAFTDFLKFALLSKEMQKNAIFGVIFQYPIVARPRNQINFSLYAKDALNLLLS